MKTLLIIGYVWPEPKSSAAGSRMLELIELFLQAQWQVVFASAATLSEHRADLAALGVQEQAILLNDSSFNQFIAELQPQAVLFDRFFSEEQFGWRVADVCPQALRLLDTEDLHSLRHIRQQLLKQQQKSIANEAERHSVGPLLVGEAEIYTAMADDDMAQREIAAIYRCDLTLMISQYEMRLLTNYFAVPPALLHYCPYLSVIAPALEQLPEFAQRQHFIVIGNFRHEPNWDAVLYLKHCLWPKIRAHLPQAELHIYGAYPPPKATQLHNPQQGFLVKGWADDALQVMQEARVCLAPLRFGAGLKGKLMDAMRGGTPSVTTSIGAEAMADSLPWGGAIADSAESFVAAALQLYGNRDLWRQAQYQGVEILQRCYSQGNHSALLLKAVQSLQQNLLPARQKNFVGGMLRHHQHKSTQYMSQWIEAKNRKP